MNIVKIKLASKQFIWGIDRVVTLTKEKESAELNFDSLNLSQKKILVLSIKRQLIECDKTFEELALFVDFDDKPVSKNTNIEPVAVKHGDSSKIKEKASSSLRGTWSNVVKKIGHIEDVRELRFMLKLENDDKKRKKVIETLEAKIAGKELEVKNSINTSKETNMELGTEEDDIGLLLDQIEEEEIGTAEVPYTK